MALAQRNARLKEVLGGGFSENFDAPETTDTAKWTGSTDAYVSERMATGVPTGRLDELRITYMVIPRLSPSIEVAIGDTVRFDYAGVEQTREVREIRAHLLPGVSETVRLYLDDS